MVEHDESAWRAVAEWHHAMFTGLILSAVARRSVADGAEFVEDVFATQRQARFVAGLEKLGLSDLPHAVAAAQYHYLSNHIGGVAVEFIPESDRKAWIRYVPPRWVWEGTALCGVPGEVSTAMLRGWHAQNGVTLGNPRLGFVCTKQTADGDDALEGYYYEYDEPLAPEQRLRFARDEQGPDVDPAALPALPTTTWPAERLAKAHRNYAMEYCRTALPVAAKLWGAQDGGDFLFLTGRLVGMQYAHQIAAGLGVDTDAPDAFEQFWTTLHQAQGAEADRVDSTITVRGGLLDDLDSAPDRAAQRGIIGLASGGLSALDRHARLSATDRGTEVEYVVTR